MNEKQILDQSKAAYKQWCVQWRKHAQQHRNFAKKSLADFENIGVGKAVLAVANGYSFEEHIEFIKEHKDNVDILACDKTMGHLLDNGIKPTYVMVCDANVDFKKYMEKWKDQLQDTILFINVCANPEWSYNGNWKDIYFFVNKDIIQSEVEFMKLSGTQNVICAGTNVSNAMIILLTQCENGKRSNFFGYDKILLTGFDYSWKAGGKYYAFNDDGDGKSKYMCHTYLTAPHSGAFLYTSGNLWFSCEWLTQYIRTFALPIVQCSKDSILNLGKVCNIEEQLRYKHKPEDRELVLSTVNRMRKLEKEIKEMNNLLTNVGRDHYWSYASSV